VDVLVFFLKRKTISAIIISHTTVPQTIKMFFLFINRIEEKDKTESIKKTPSFNL
jgi:hypothetical protein